MVKTNMDNSGIDKLQVPGFNEVPLTYELPPEDRFTHGINEYAQIPAITAREFAMVAAMNDITDRTGWWYDISDDSIVSAWKKEEFSCHSLLSEKAWLWIMAELRDKAVEYHHKRFVRVLDTGSCVCKSDHLLDESTSNNLRTSLNPLFDRASKTQERCIVDPKLYPLVYGETKVLQDGGTVLLSFGHPNDMVLLDDRAVMSDRPPAFTVDAEEMAKIQKSHASDRRKAHFETGREHVNSDQYWWSSTYQSLPCDVEFADDGAVNITSYINNLHPSHQPVYAAIEQIISASVKMWDECLIKGVVDSKRGLAGTEKDNVSRFRHQTQRGRYPLRIITYGVEWREQLPDWARCLCSDHVTEMEEYAWAKHYLIDPPTEEFETHTRPVRGVHHLDNNRHLEDIPPVPKRTGDTLRMAEEYVGRSLDGRDTWDVEQAVMEEADRRRYWLHPEPGTAFTYEDWKTSEDIQNPVVKMVKQLRNHWRSYDHEPCEEPALLQYTIDLADTFHDTGLQIIVNISDINLAPGEIHDGAWQLDGHLNEHVVGRACYVFDDSNIACSVSFCQETPMYARAYRYAGNMQGMCTEDDPTQWHYDSLNFDDNLSAIAQLFGWSDGDVLMSGEMLYNTELPVQETGTVQLTQGRLITFPNIFEYRLQAQPVDDIYPAHIKFVWLQLVDPSYRVCSTKNVPPQQSEWASAQVVKLLMKKGLPAELALQIVQNYDYPMSQERAQEHKRRMEEEQIWIQVARHADMTSFHFPYPSEF